MTALRCGLIGAGLSRSRFGAALALLAEAEGEAVDFTLIDTEGQSDFDISGTLTTCRDAGWRGVSVTHPFKAQAADWLTTLSPEIIQTGATNLILFDTPAKALNTDFRGFLTAWRTVMGAARPGTVAIAGAGGVAGALGAALLALGAERLILWDPDQARATRLAKRLGSTANAVTGDAIAAAIRSADGLVNATPLGMGNDRRSAFDAGLIGPQRWAFDAVYTPVETPFLRQCAVRGLTRLTGFDLFRFMAVESFGAYLGHPLPPREADRLLPLKP